MAMRNPVGRVNYEPNSWPDGGPRENPKRGFRSFAEEAEGPKVRLRPESFADHYSQARLFFISQTPQEQKHICDALVFELSKCEREDIRERMVSHLVNIHPTLAGTVAAGLGIDLPEPATAAQPTREDLEASPALSIVKRGPKSFEGRKLGILITDGANADLYAELVAAIEEVGGVCEVIAPKISGATLSNGETVLAKQKIDGGPSVLYDAVAILASEDGAALLSADKPSKDFASDAFAHCKFIGYSDEAMPLLQKAGIGPDLDEGCFALGDGISKFIDALAELRHWAREPDVDLDSVEQK